MVYALGRPIATTRDRDSFFSHLSGGRSILTVALPSESQVMRNHFKLSVTVVDQVEGLVLTKGKLQTFQVVVVKEGDDTVGRISIRFQGRSAGCRLEGAARKVSGAAASWFRGETGRRSAAALRRRA